MVYLKERYHLILLIVCSLISLDKSVIKGGVMLLLLKDYVSEDTNDM